MQPGFLKGLLATKLKQAQSTPTMSEGNVYPCCWEKTEDGFKIWLEKRPKLMAEGESLQDAMDELSGVVCLAIGDGEAVFDLSPPPGVKGNDDFVTLSGNDCWSPPPDFNRAEYASLYERGLCKTCCTGIGPRTKKPLRVGNFGKGDMLASRLRLPNAILASDQFRKIPGRSERALIDWRPIEVMQKSRRLFYELIAKTPIKMVVDRKQRAVGWHCKACGYRLFSVLSDYDNTYVAKSDLRTPTPKLLTIDDPRHLTLAIPASRWKAIRGRPGTTSMIAGRVRLLPKHRVLRRPKVISLTRNDSIAINSEFDGSVALCNFRGNERQLLALSRRLNVLQGC